MTIDKVESDSTFRRQWSIIQWYLVEFFRVFVEPLLCHLGLMTPNFGDPTYGRASLPRSKDEQDLIFNNPKVKVREGLVNLKGDTIRKGGSWDRPGFSFVAYSTWQMDDAMEREQLNADIGES
jgi:hypothetical protein